jgi:hypothetical protein
VSVSRLLVLSLMLGVVALGGCIGVGPIMFRY